MAEFFVARRRHRREHRMRGRRERIFSTRINLFGMPERTHYLNPTEPLKGHGGGKNWGGRKKMFKSLYILLQNVWVPSRNFAFACKTFAFSRKDIFIPSQNFCILHFYIGGPNCVLIITINSLLIKLLILITLLIIY